MDNSSIDMSFFRPVRCELNFLSRPDGSAIFSLGDTIFLSAVYGPVEVKLQKVQIDRATIEAVYRPISGISGVGDRLKENLIKNTCETALMAALFPRTSINIIIQNMQDSGGGLACAVNAACAALIYSGLPIKFLFAASACMLSEDDKIITDPDSKQLETAKGSFTFVFDSASYSVIASHTEGKFSDKDYQQALIRCKVGADQLFTYYRHLARKYKPVPS
uniref:Uncharacterized protein n=2 Tax=Clastoptera arizonana TaxID=38151 RepID=A0A1B6CIX3_9HEMI